LVAPLALTSALRVPPIPRDENLRVEMEEQVKMPSQPEGYFTTDQAARRLKITKGKLRYLIAQGRLPAEKRDGRLWIPARAVDTATLVPVS
jgi:excisionase family DNA binding protein